MYDSLTPKRGQHTYNDIINLPHPTSRKHPRMSLQDRAAQFAPFAALTGHDAAIQETARTTDRKIELDEDQQLRLNEQLQLLQASLPSPDPVTCTYFVPDTRKTGGEYVSHTGIVKKLDSFQNQILFEDQTVIPIQNLFKIE